MMAKAAANHTDSVFVSASGSEFVEMYVGVGAQRIRDLFRQARSLARKHKKSSAIVFIDEIDVIGGRREGTSHREYDQTLNQLLTEMDGITVDPEVRILVMAATNRKDMLDPALLRPGRFDRHITVDLPDKKGRLQVLRLHTRNKPLSSEVDLERIAEETFGFSGAQLESVTNEAAIYALRDRKEQIEPVHFAQAIDKVMMGEKTDRDASLEEKERVAVHELGHAIISERVRNGSVSRVVLSPRGQALGYVRQHPGEDRHLYTRTHLEGQIRVCLAGAAAEEMVYGNRSTGAKNDFEQATRFARAMVETGLSDLGIVDPGLIDAGEMHQEVRNILGRLFDETLQELKRIRPAFDEMLQRLLQEEQLSGDDFRKLLTKCA
jgi:cell division protease FtsH